VGTQLENCSVPKSPRGPFLQHLSIRSNYVGHRCLVPITGLPTWHIFQLVEVQKMPHKQTSKIDFDSPWYCPLFLYVLVFHSIIPFDEEPRDAEIEDEMIHYLVRDLCWLLVNKGVSTCFFSALLEHIYAPHFLQNGRFRTACNAALIGQS
jgi:hypothetical protein